PSGNVPRVPSGMAGSTLTRAANALMIFMFSSETSMMVPQAEQATLVVWSKPRKLIGLPHCRHLKVFTLGGAGLSPSIELPQIREMKVIKIHVLAHKDQWLSFRSVGNNGAFAVVDRRKTIFLTHKIGDRRIVSGADLEGKFALAADASGGVDILYFEPLP